MGLKADIQTNVHDVVYAPWSPTNAIKVPADNVALKAGVVKLNATYLYADMVGTSKMVHSLTAEATAKSIKAFLAAAVRCMRGYSGEIRSFDGDRVMAIFTGGNHINTAVRCALAINAATSIVDEELAKKFNDYRKAWQVEHVCGIDTGEAHIVTAGIAGGATDNRDMVSVGTAPNVAAKLSDIRGSGYSTYITEAVYQQLERNLVIMDNGHMAWARVWNGINVGGHAYAVHGTNCIVSLD